MSAEATLNVRLPCDLKQRGDAVLSREGVSASKAVRALYRYIDQEQQLPEWLNGGGEDVYQKRREGIHRLVGVVSLPEDFDARTIREQRLSRLEF